VAPRNRIMLAVAAAGFVAIMAGPTAYSLSTVGQAYSGGDPAAGPTSARVTAFGDSGFGGFGSGRFTPPDNAPAFSGDGAPSGARGAGGGGGLNQVNNALITYLDSHQGKATWLVAVDGANQAAAIELATGKPVMAMGGFIGSDPAPTLAQLEALVKSGQLRYVLITGPGGAGGSNSSATSITSWVTQHGTAVNYGSGSSASGTLYDLAGAAG
jgi:hypothetical protein